MEFKKTYMKYMSQGSGGKYKDKNAPNKTNEPEKFQGDGGFDEKPVTEGDDKYDAYVKMMLKKKGIKNLGDLSDEETKAFFAEIDKGYKAKNENYNNVDSYPKADAKGGSKTEYPVKNKPNKKKKPKDGWQGDDGGVSDVVEKKLKAEVPMAFDLRKYADAIDAYAKVLEKEADKVRR